MHNREKYIVSLKLHVHEKILSDIIGKYEGIVIFDIGACEGENSIRYSRLFPNATIYAFEPLPSNFELITKNIETWNTKNILPFQLCLSEKKGEMSFYVSSGKPENAGDEDWDYGNKSSSLLSPAKTKQIHPWLKFEDAISVQATTLKDFCEVKNITSIDFIHMDVQGAELMVLKGAKDFISKINMVWLEVEAIELYKDQPLQKDIEDFMSGSGFIKIEDTVYDESGDQFWVRKEYILRSKSLLFVYQTILFSQFKGIFKKIRRRLFK